jgi:hypothetical protein
LWDGANTHVRREKMYEEEKRSAGRDRGVWKSSSESRSLMRRA